jgi:hypothetical protein
MLPLPRDPINAEQAQFGDLRQTDLVDLLFGLLSGEADGTLVLGADEVSPYPLYLLMQGGMLVGSSAAGAEDFNGVVMAAFARRGTFHFHPGRNLLHNTRGFFRGGLDPVRAVADAVRAKQCNERVEDVLRGLDGATWLHRDMRFKLSRLALADDLSHWLDTRKELQLYEILECPVMSDDEARVALYLLLVTGAMHAEGREPAGVPPCRPSSGIWYLPPDRPSKSVIPMKK